ncbi:MAG: hypothetical protein HYY40_05095 [Bacteroidetes bacterium]|nr:hypothetical protein [Bacteroidota bacterium]
MKQYLRFSVCILSVFSGTAIFAQRGKFCIDSKAVLIRGLEHHDKGDYEDAFRTFDSIPLNDSNYIAALYEKSYSCMKMNKYDSVIALCREGLSYRSRFDSDFYNNIGTAYDDKKMGEEALKIYDEGISRFPKSHLLRFNKAVALEKMERYADAIAAYKEAIAINPFFPTAHIRLGLLCAGEGKYCQAMLCFNTFLTLEPNSDRAFMILKYFNDMLGENPKIEPKNIALSAAGDDFSEIDLLIKNRVALNINYKIKSKLKLPVVKQNHLLLEKLEYRKNDPGFWMQTYVPFYKKLFSEGWFDAFTYHNLQSTTNEQLMKDVKKNGSSIKKFSDWAIGEWLKTHENQSMVIDAKSKPVVYFYTTVKYLEGIGEYDGSKKVLCGYTEFYHSNGALSQKGYFNRDGKKTGQWVMHHDNGNIKNEVTYDNGKMDGPYKIYYESGILKEEGTYKNGLISGNLKIYGNTGVLKETYNYKNDTIHGEFISYYPTGVKEKVLKLSRGKLSGMQEEFHDNGTRKSEYRAVKGEIEGEYKTYDRKGRMESVKNYSAGNLNGPYKIFYPDGKTEKEGILKNGNITGTWKTYHNNGQPYEITGYNEKGKLNGLSKVSDIDGKIHYEVTYKDDAVASSRYYDKNGKIISEQNNPKNIAKEYSVYYPDGTLKAKGPYPGTQKTGEWKFYDKNGVLSSIENYNKNGSLEGKSESWFPSGKTESVSNYKDNVSAGYFVNYYSNGNIEREGYLKNGMKTGPIYSYYPDGTIDQVNYYTEDKTTGWQKYYSVNGKISSLEFYENGYLIKFISYDTIGAVLEEIPVKAGTSEFIIRSPSGKTEYRSERISDIRHGKDQWYYPNGTVRSKGSFHNDQENGKFEWFFLNGKSEITGNYYYGEKDSIWTTYWESGKIKSIEYYNQGKDTGVWVNYYEDGKINNTKSFFNDKRHGPSHYYSPDGQLMIVKYFTYGKFTGYSYNGSDGTLKETIPVINETAKVIAYHGNGNKSMEHEVNKGDFNGTMTEYYSSGKIFRTTGFLDDNYDGKRITYSPEGKILSDETWFQDELHGLCKYYRKSGSLEKEIPYLYGTRHGTVRYFNEKGKLQKTLLYYNGVLLKETVEK